MKNAVKLIIFLLLISSCSQNKQDKQEILVNHIKQLINSSEINDINIIARETQTKNGYIYRIHPSSTPFLEGDYIFPSDIIKYKNKYICIFKEGEKELSEETVFEITDFYNQPIEDTSSIIWYLGIFKNEDKSIIIKTDDNSPPEDHIQLWPILSSEYDPKATINIITSYISYRAIEGDKGDKYPFFPISIYGSIYIMNMTDSDIPLNLSPNTGSYFAVLNKEDTLIMNIDLEINNLDKPLIKLEPNKIHKLCFSSSEHTAFFSKLDKNNFSKQLFDLEKDSFFYINSSKMENILPHKLKICKSEYSKLTDYSINDGRRYRFYKGEWIEDY